MRNPPQDNNPKPESTPSSGSLPRFEELRISLDESERLAACSTEQLISWDEVLFLQRNCYGLRHVTDKAKLHMELQNGIRYGDAVSLACPQRFLRDDEISQALPLFEGRVFWALSPERKAGHRSEDVLLEHILENWRPIVMERFINEVKSFLMESIKWDMNDRCSRTATFGDTASLFETKTGGFLLLQNEDARRAYDHANYPLGKCGTRDIPVDQIKGVVYFDGFVDYLRATDSEARELWNEVGNGGCADKLIGLGAEYLWTKVAALIRANRAEEAN